ncbi:MAG: double-strand break repair protein AddB [Novosphingopyxis baekryungensis]|nr:double-strand break repair protein AddB [Novosphingopyxis baekryungensis]
MGSRAKPAIYTIPAHRGFADALAAGMLDRFADGDRGLSGGMILIPNNRAARAISDAFVRRAAPGLLLPRMVPIGDLDLGEALGLALDPVGADVPPAIDPLTRRLAVARIVQRRMKVDGAGVSAPEALRLADQFARALDQLIIERKHVDALGQLSLAEELADHYQRSLALFSAVAQDWSAHLRSIGRIDVAERRNQLIDGVAARWGETPPAGFVVAAGITTAAPAIALLQRVVAELPKGQVVLPDLDIAMPDDEWSEIGPHAPRDDGGPVQPALETHPQFHLKLLLDRMGIARGEVMRWVRSGESDAPARRAHAISNAFAPPDATGKWQDLPAERRSLAGVRVLEAPDSAAESQAIAILIREALEQPGKRAALATPDRELARRVSAHLRRWGIEADDSAGRPLSDVPVGTFMLALAEAAAQNFAPVALLSLLKHPLVRSGDQEHRLAWLNKVRSLDLLLRGPRSAGGLAGVADRIARRIADDAGREPHISRWTKLQDWWTDVLPILAPMQQAARSAPSALDVLRTAAEALTGDRIWRGREGRMLADLWADLSARAADGPTLAEAEELPDWLEALMTDISVRPAYGGHPRVAIYGLLEARLQQADLVICGGLNEGTWPMLPQPDPWLAPRIRRELGLPALERSTGLAAHDLAGMMGAPEVVLSRARRDRSGPGVASRFLLRLQAMAGTNLRQDDRALALAAMIDAPGKPTPAERPKPRPTAAQRKVALNITDLDRLKADPFAFYASRILGLRALDPVDADPTPAWRGTKVHEILEEWAKQDQRDPAKLHERAQALLAKQGAHPLMRALWEPRLLQAIDWIAEETRRLEREQGRSIAIIEESGTIDFAGVTLKGRVDRIDRCADGSLVIVDYKTGKPPGKAQVRAGYALQLGLTGLIVEHGGVDSLSGTAGGFEYWSLAKAVSGPRKGELGYIDTPVGGRGDDAIAADDFVAHAAHHVREAIEMWLLGDAPFTAMLHPEYSPYGDYDHLMRLDEWYGRGAA